jgi:AraC family transcriptional regulator, glycine betaine-responsive activator
MFESLRGSRPLRAAFLLIPRFSLMSFASAVEPLRAANRLSGQALYEWCFVTSDGRPVEASNGMAVLPHASIETVEPCPLVVVCAGLDAQAFDDRRPLGWLRRRALEGAIVGSVSTGSYILAKAGLLHGHRCTTHWENLAGFREDWPELEVTDQLFEVDHNRFTCSGGTAALDLMLQLIALQHGPELSAGVSEQFLHPHLRSAADDQRMALRERLQTSHPRLLAAILAMEKHLEEPLAGKQIAREVGLSKRQVERLFRSYLGCTFSRYYLELRLNRAQQLVSQTSMPILEIALACGFVSASHFSRSYRRRFGRTPRDERAPPRLSATSARRGALTPTDASPIEAAEC